MFWFIILTTVMNSGEVYTDVRPVNDPDYNNERSCNEAGKVLVDQKQVEVGTANGKTYFICQAFSEEDIYKVLGKSNT